MLFLLRLRLNCCGIFDVLTFDNSQSNPMALTPHYQVSSYNPRLRLEGSKGCLSVSVVLSVYLSIHPSVDTILCSTTFFYQDCEGYNEIDPIIMTQAPEISYQVVDYYVSYGPLNIFSFYSNKTTVKGTGGKLINVHHFRFNAL